jgi:pilus assembly protein Flp/PilA
VGGGPLYRDEDGATAIEYALVAALVSIAVIGGLILLGGNVEALFTRVATALQ